MADWIKVTVVTTGANGSGAGNTSVELAGGIGHSRMLVGVYIPASQTALPSTSDVKIRHVLPDGLFSDIVTFTDVSAVVRVIVQNLVYDAAGAVTTSLAYPYLGDRVNVSIAQANAGTILVYLLVA